MSGVDGSGWFAPLDWVLVRTPLLPLARYLELGDPGPRTEPAAASEDGEAALSERWPVLRDPEVSRAIAVASPSLFAQLARGAATRSAARRGRAATLRYLIRFSTRCTPFGLTAGVSLAGWGEQTDLELGPREIVRARLDMGMLDALIGALEQRLEVVRMLELRAHPLLGLRAGRAFLPERFSPDTGALEVSVRASAPVRRVLELCRPAPVPFSELAGVLASDFPAAGSERIEGLIHGLLTEGLLTSELRPALTRGEPAAHLLAVLEPIPAARDARERLAAAVTACEDWARQDPRDGAGRFATVTRAAEAVAPAPVGVPPVRTDMRRLLRGHRISGAVAQEGARAVELLTRLSPLHIGQLSLNAYRDRFLDRYGTEAEVPIRELLDPDLGLGPIDLRLDTAPGRVVDDHVRRRDLSLYRMAAASLQSGARTIELTPSMIAELGTEPDRELLPRSAELSAYVDAPSREALDAGDFRLIVSPMLGSHGAGRILGRFAYLFGEDGTRALADAARHEEAESADELWAELVYSPERPWLSNVMLRPSVRPHEIVLGGAPGVGTDGDIGIDELVVGSVDGTFYLRSPSRGAYVEVSETHMLNPKTAPALGAFLALMRHAGRPVMTAFAWGSARELPRLPRVQTGRIVLSLATWRPSFDADELSTSATFALALDRWREQWSMPRHVFAAQGDHRLLLDLEDPDQRDLVRGLLVSHTDETTVVLQEALPGTDAAWLPGPAGRYLVELAIPVALRPSPRSRADTDGADTARPGIRRALPPADLPPPPSRGERVRGPGTEWPTQNCTPEVSSPSA